MKWATVKLPFFMTGAGLITYLLLAMYCSEQHNEKVSIKRVRGLRIKIQNEIRIASSGIVGSNF